MNGKRLMKFISGTVVASVVLTTSFTTFAAQRNNNLSTAFNKAKNVVYANGANEEKGPHKKNGKGGNFTSFLADMVKDGTLTQIEADKIAAYKKEKQKSMKAEMDKVKKMTAEERKNYLSTKKIERQNLLTELVSKGIITQTKADVIKGKVEQKHQEMKAARLAEMKSKLNTLVTKGTIDQTQANKVIEYVNQRQDRVKIEKGNISQTEKDKIKSMTEAERKAYFEKIRGEKGTFLKELVDNGTLTQDQANAVRDSIHPQHEKGMKGK